MYFRHFLFYSYIKLVITLLYIDIWAWRTEEDDFKGEVIEHLLEGELRVTVEKEIRVQVDNLMRQELQRLKEVNYI